MVTLHLSLPGVTEVLRLSAEAGLQVYPRFAPTMEWDTAARTGDRRVCRRDSAQSRCAGAS